LLLLGTVIGLLGGLGGVGGAALSLGLGVIGYLFEIPGSSVCLSDAIILLVLAFLGASGGLAGFYRPKLGALLQFLAALGGILVSFLLWVIPFVLFVAGALALITNANRKKDKKYYGVGKIPIQSYWNLK
jgi:hypothetical protein